MVAPTADELALVVAATATEGRTAIVTGAASGIGEGTAVHLARLGHRVGLIDRDREGASVLADELDAAGGQAVAVPADVSDEVQVERAVAQISDQLGAVEVLVNNAGFARDSDVADMPLEAWDDAISTHLRGTFLLSRAVLAGMRSAHWGRIVNISSISALAHAGRANYVAAKAGIEAFTKALAHEEAGHGITANAIGPGVVVTGMTAVGAQRLGRTLDQHVEALRRTVPVGRVGTPHDIARAVAFFADEDADFITGQVLYVSGGPHG
ncbi:MAG TPA: SDR family NAD(P)-dependent oxidoreductase [Nocardioidaceae bacterium]|nr:SDR family NAD(P)-dependent oxidoreductase [Nocardioidaceae bacterium]